MSAKMIVHGDDIERAAYDFQERYKIDDLRQATQSVWNAFLRYCAKTVFVPARTFFGVHGDISRVSLEIAMKAYKWCDYYIDLCSLYEKEITLIGFSNFTGIFYNVLKAWNSQCRDLDGNFELLQEYMAYLESVEDNGEYNDTIYNNTNTNTPDNSNNINNPNNPLSISVANGELLRTLIITLTQKLYMYRQDSLSSMLTERGTKRNPVGVLGILNHAYAWNMPGVRESRPREILAGREQLGLESPGERPKLPGEVRQQEE